MAQMNSSSEVLTIDTEKEKTEKEPENYGNFITNSVANVQNGIAGFGEKNSRFIGIGIKLIIYSLLVAYFAIATMHFIDEDSYLTIHGTACTGYGFLMILFIFINFFICYYLLLKPFIVNPLYKSIWEPISGPLSRFLSLWYVSMCIYLVIFGGIVAYLIYDARENQERLVALSGIVIFLFLGFLCSKHPNRINWHPVIWGILLQFGFGMFTLRWDVGRDIFQCLGDKATTFLGYAQNGSAFVYGEDLVFNQAIFAFQALCTIYFLAFMINILYHYGIMQKIVVTIGEFLQSIMGTSICESVNSAANIFLGQTEAPLLLKPYLDHLTVSEIHAIMASGFSTVSGTVLAAYISFGANASHLITSSVMSAPAALCFAKLVFPETEKTAATRENITMVKSEYSSVLDAASQGATQAINIVLGITSNLIAFIAFIYFINGVLEWMGILVGFTGDDIWALDKAAGYLFIPVSYIMGVPTDECKDVGRLIGIKTLVNEFAAFREMGKMELRGRTKVIATYAICGFANPGSIGIVISGLGALMPKRRDVITAHVFRALISGCVVCFMTACIAGLLTPNDLV